MSKLDNWNSYVSSCRKNDSEVLLIIFPVISRINIFILSYMKDAEYILKWLHCF